MTLDQALEKFRAAKGGGRPLNADFCAAIGWEVRRGYDDIYNQPSPRAHNPITYRYLDKASTPRRWVSLPDVSSDVAAIAKFIEARGWTWSVRCLKPGFYGVKDLGPLEGRDYFAATPALALRIAFLEAVKHERDRADYEARKRAHQAKGRAA